MNDAYKDLKKYLEVAQQEKLEPRCCFKRHSLIDPTICKRYSEGIENGEPDGACCSGCPIQDYEYCPDIESDRLSIAAIEFTSWYDHPAHAEYRNELFPIIGPSLSPQELMPWLQRRQIVWEFYQTKARELQQKEMDALRKTPE